jgi:hypothetical protein
MQNDIENTIDKWFEHTMIDIMSQSDAVRRKDVDALSPVDKLCMTVLPLANNYCKAIFSLTRNDHRLPVMALIRTIGELALRVTWCLEGNTGETPEVRIERLRKRAYKQYLRILYNFPDAFERIDADVASGVRQVIDAMQKEINSWPHKEAPPLYNSLADLPSEAKVTHALVYAVHNIAAHPDILLMESLTETKEGARYFMPDTKAFTSNDLRRNCLHAARTIVLAIRQYYRLDVNEIEKDFIQLAKGLT